MGTHYYGIEVPCLPHQRKLFSTIHLDNWWDRVVDWLDDSSVKPMRTFLNTKNIHLWEHFERLADRLGLSLSQMAVIFILEDYCELKEKYKALEIEHRLLLATVGDHQNG